MAPAAAGAADAVAPATNLDGSCLLVQGSRAEQRQQGTLRQPKQKGEVLASSRQRGRYSVKVHQ